MRFAPEYVTYVLNENFEDAKELLLAPLMAIDYAHLVMLARQGIVPRADAHRIREALDSVSQDEVKLAKYDGTFEDLFFYVEQLVIDACGEEAAGRLHTARSRNDIDMTMYRMRQREFILGLMAGSFELRR
jgi:argininosuccinate lyase